MQKRTLRLIAALLKNSGANCQIHLHVGSMENAVEFSRHPRLTVSVGEEFGGRHGKGLGRALLDFRPDICVGCFGRDVVRLLALKVVMALFVRPRLIAIQAVPVALPNVGWATNIARQFSVALFYSLVDRIVCVSNDVRTSLTSVAPWLSRKALTIYNPVVGDEIDLKSEVGPDGWRGREGKRIVSVGRLHFQKDYPTLINALIRLKHRGRVEFSALILGDGPDREFLQNMIDADELSGQVTLFGHCENPFRIVADADLFVMSSRWEGLPSALIEALYLSVPCVSTDCIAGPREILDGGKLGALVPVGDAHALSLKIEEGLLQKTVNREALKSRGAMFSNDGAASKYLDLFRDVLA